MTPRGLRMSRVLVAIIAVVGFDALPFAQYGASPGPMVVWGTNENAPGAPAGDFRALAAAGGAQTLAIRADGTLYLSSVPADLPPNSGIPEYPGLATDTFVGVGMGRNHALAIRPDGSLVVWGVWMPGSECATVGPATTGDFVAVTGGGGHSVALDSTGRIVIWGSPTLGVDYGAVVGVGAPVGITFKAIAAKTRYTLALGDDGNIYGWGTDGPLPPGTRGIVKDVIKVVWTPYGPNHFIAPSEAGNPYTAIAAGLNLVAALRSDGSVVVWDATGTMPAPPAGVVFKQPEPLPSSPATIAAGSGYAVGIDQAGHLHAWGDPDSRAAIVGGVPDGLYSAVSGANAHVTAIAIPALTALAPANVWLGLKNSDDVGTRFDLQAEVLLNGVVVGSGQTVNVPGGSSGFNNAVKRSIALSLIDAVAVSPGDRLSLRLSVRIAQGVPGHRSGTARLWFNDAAAKSGFGATVRGIAASVYLVGASAPSTFALNTAVGAGPKRSVDVFVDRAAAGNPFKPFGTWSMVVP
jgi:hypothetical protein